MKKQFLLLSAFILSGCVMSDGELRERDAEHYSQSPAYVAAFKQRIDTMSANEIAAMGAESDRARMQGQPRMKVDDTVYIEKIEAKGSDVIYHYSLSAEWLNKPAAAREDDQKNMQKDLIYRTCSLQTVRLAQAKGLAEIHYYYDDYPGHVLFTLNANKALCEKNGF